MISVSKILPRGAGGGVVVAEYRGTSLIRNIPCLEDYSRFMLRALW